jgi:DNA-binding MarR family transcriptional regulator
MTDIIAATDLALKDMTRLWNETFKQRLPNARPMSYQRFKTLRAVVNGSSTVQEIADAAGSDLSTTTGMMAFLMAGKYVTREPLDFRTFTWRATKLGRSETEKMSSMLELIHEEIKHIAKTRLEKLL